MDAKNKKGYTLAEILMVVAIISILASMAGPLYMQHVKRAVASEAVAMIALVRQSLKDYYINSGEYYDVASDHIQNALPDSVTSGVPSPEDAGGDVDAGVAQYFSNHSFTVDATNPSSARFTNPPVVDFLIVVNGADSVACSDVVTSNCAIKATSIADYDLEMDNSGRIFISYDNGTQWRAY